MQLCAHLSFTCSAQKSIGSAAGGVRDHKTAQVASFNVMSWKVQDSLTSGYEYLRRRRAV